MKKTLTMLLAIALLVMPFAGLADGVALKTTSTFAGTDAGAQAYIDLLEAWQAETGNSVEDFSATSDEAWKASVLQDVSVGGLDVLFYFAGGADSAPLLEYVVPMDEVVAAYPDAGISYGDTLKEADGKVYAIPVRPFWEAMFVNKDLFEAHGLELPTDWAKFETAVAKFNEVGIVPISVSLSDIPHYLVELAMLSSGTADEHRARPANASEMPASWVKGMELIHTMYEMGCFAPDVNNTTEELTSAMFKNKEAAMQLDGSWFANGISEDNFDTTIVMPFPAHDPSADPTAIIGGASMGFYITRSAWEDETKRDAAVSLLAFLTSEQAIADLGFFFGGDLLRSTSEMVAGAGSIVAPIQDAMNPEVRNSTWFAKVPGIADGTEDPTEVMTNVANSNVFVLAE